MDPYGIPYGGIKYNGHPCLLVKDPREYLHMRLVKVVLRLVCGWPGKELGEKLLKIEGKYYAFYSVGLSLFFFCLQLGYLAAYGPSLTFYELGHMYVALLMNSLCSSRGFTLCLSKRYKLFAVRFLTQMHVFYHKDKSDYSRLIYTTVHKITNYFTIWQTFLMGSALLLFNMMPVLMNYNNGKFENAPNDPINTTYELSIYYLLPFDPEREFDSYIYSLILNWYGSILCATSIIMFDLFLAIIIFNLWGHFKILLHDLNMFPKPAAINSNDGSMPGFLKTAVMYSSSEQVEISRKLKESIIYHRSIVDFTNEMSDVFGVVLFIYYTFHQVSGCLMLLECSQGADALARYLPLTFMMFAQLIQTSIIFETIGSMSEKIRDEVYCLPWEYMNKKNRTTVLLFLINVQEPIHIKAGGLVDVGVTTMAGILKASFSYFAFLRTMGSQ